MTNNVTNKWEELKALVESLEADVQKNATGNKAAGTRARMGVDGRVHGSGLPTPRGAGAAA